MKELYENLNGNHISTESKTRIYKSLNQLRNEIAESIKTLSQLTVTQETEKITVEKSMKNLFKVAKELLPLK